MNRGTRLHQPARHQFLYKLEDRAGEPLHGTWHSQKIQPIRANRFLIEKIIRRRQRAQEDPKAKRASSRSEANAPECLVKWKGWPTKFNTWIPESDIADLNSIKKSTKPPHEFATKQLLSTVMANSETSFQITHPSNASSKLFPENRANSYGTKLYKTLDLGGGGECDWEVALVDIAFPHNWANILESTEIEMVLERIAKAQSGSDGGAAGSEVTSPSPMGMFTTPKGHYSSVHQIWAIMNSLYQKGLLSSSSTPFRAEKRVFPRIDTEYL